MWDTTAELLGLLSLRELNDEELDVTSALKCIQNAASMLYNREAFLAEVSASYDTLVVALDTELLLRDRRDNEDSLLFQIIDVLGLLCDEIEMASTREHEVVEYDECGSAIDTEAIKLKHTLWELELHFIKVLSMMSLREVTEGETSAMLALEYLFDAPQRLQQEDITKEKFLDEVKAAYSDVSESCLDLLALSTAAGFEGEAALLVEILAGLELVCEPAGDTGLRCSMCDAGVLDTDAFAACRECNIIMCIPCGQKPDVPRVLSGDDVTCSHALEEIGADGTAENLIHEPTPTPSCNATAETHVKPETYQVGIVEEPSRMAVVEDKTQSKAPVLGASVESKHAQTCHEIVGVLESALGGAAAVKLLLAEGDSIQEGVVDALYDLEAEAEEVRLGLGLRLEESRVITQTKVGLCADPNPSPNSGPS